MSMIQAISVSLEGVCLMKLEEKHLSGMIKR